MPIQKGSFTPGPSYDKFKGKGDGYEGPQTEDGAGDRKVVSGKHKSVIHGKGGAKSGEYENAAAATTSPQQNKESRLGGGGKKSGYDNASIEKDFGFQGHGGSRHPKNRSVDKA